jgi:hypothetical protein
VSAVGADAEVDTQGHQVVDQHEDHRAYVRPADIISSNGGQGGGEYIRIPEPDDQLPVKEAEEDQTGQGENPALNGKILHAVWHFQ